MLSEVAGISFIVRDWAKILQKEVQDKNEEHQKVELEKIKSEKPKSEKPKTDDPFYWEDETSKGTGSKAKPWQEDEDWPFNFSPEDMKRVFGSESKKSGKRWKQNDFKKGGYYKKSYGSEEEFDYGFDYGFGRPYVPPIQEIVVDGKKYPEQYKNFSVDKWVMKNSNRIEYDHWHSGYNENGEYVVYLNIPIMSMTSSAFIHEIKHAYDDWNRMKSGGKAIRSSWEIKNIYTPDFEKLVLGGSTNYPQLGPLIRYFYLGSKLETPAYLENEYDAAMVDYEGIGRKLKNFKIDQYFTKDGKPAKGLEEEFRAIQKLDIPVFKKYKNVTEFLNWAKKYFNKRGEDIFRRVVKMKAVHGKPITGLTYEPKTYGTFKTQGPAKETKKEIEPEFDFEEGEMMGDWRYSKDRGWYQVEGNDKDEDNFYSYYD